MAYPQGHRENVRSRIIDSARQLFNRHGFEHVSINAIMAHAGLTRGAFYTYFKSKSDLYEESLDCFFTNPNWKNRWCGVEINAALPDVGPQIIRAYLSRQHFENVENSCPMVALPVDVARGGRKLKAAFENVFKAMVNLIGREVIIDEARKEEAAMAVASLCIGGMVIARALNDDQFSNRVREAATDAALQIGGWKKRKPAPQRRI